MRCSFRRTASWLVALVRYIDGATRRREARRAGYIQRRQRRYTSESGLVGHQVSFSTITSILFLLKYSSLILGFPPISLGINSFDTATLRNRDDRQLRSVILPVSYLS